MPTGSEKWPKAALGQDEVGKAGQNQVKQVCAGGMGVAQVGGWSLEDIGQRTEALGPQDCKTSQRI